MKKIMKNTAILTAITLIAGLLLGLVYEITKEPIAKSQEAAKQEAYKSVLSDAESFENVEVQADAVDVQGCRVDEVAEAKAGNETVGYVVTTTSSEGYGGDIQISVGISMDGTVTGVEILSIGETAGLGMKAKEESFREQYVDKAVDSFTVTKSGASSESEIDALSGATITSKAFTNAVNTGLAYFHTVLGGSANE